jgi:hypothetical protein
VKLRTLFLLPETGELVVAFCRLVFAMRSFATVDLKRSVDCSGEASGERFLFSGNENTPETAREHVNAALQRSGMETTLRAYRLWQAGIARAMRAAGRANQAALVATTLLDSNVEGEELSRVEKVAVEQPGHTAETATAHCGRSSLDEVHGVDPSDTLPLYRITSHVWQSQLGLREAKATKASHNTVHRDSHGVRLPSLVSLTFLKERFHQGMTFWRAPSIWPQKARQ